MDRRVLGPCVASLVLLTAAGPGFAQTRATQGPSQGPSPDLNTENRGVNDEDEPRRYEVYDPGAGYGRGLYLNDQYFLRGTPQRGPSSEPNRTGAVTRRNDEQPAERVSEAKAERLRGDVVRVQSSPVADHRPAGMELVVRLSDGAERPFWLGDTAYAAEHLPPLTPGDPVTVVGISTPADEAPAFTLRWVETPTGRYESPYYQFGQVVEAKLLGTREHLPGDSQPGVLVGSLELSDGREVEMALGSAADLSTRGVTPREGAAVQIEGYLRSGPKRQWSFVVEDVKVDGESTRHPGPSHQPR